MASKRDKRVWVRVTVNMAGVHRGMHVLVDPENEHIAQLIDRGRLVLEEPGD